MATRRNFGEALQPLNDVLMQFYRIQKQRETNEMENRMILQRQRLMNEQEFKNRLFDRALSDPQFARRLQATGKFPELDSFMPSNDELAKGISDTIGKATDEAALPTGQDLTASLRASGGDVSPALGAKFSPSQPSDTGPTLESTQYAPVQNRTLTNLGNQVDAKRAALEAAATRKRQEMPAEVESIDASGNKVKRFGTRGEFEKMGPIPTERTGQQEGQRKNAELIAGELAPNVTKAKAGQAGAVAGAQENATLGARFSDKNVAGAAKLAGAEAQAREDAKGATPDDRKAVAFLTRSISAANNATALEANDKLSAGRASYFPEPVKGELAKKYNQAKHEFVLAALRRETGAQVNKEEFDQFDKAYFQQPNDTPDVVKAKQEARLRFIESLRYEAMKGLKEFNKLGNQVPTVVTGDPLSKLRGR